MLNTATAVGFVSTRDADKARAFYGDVLGLTVEQDPYALIAVVGDAQLRITTLPDFQAGDAPVFGFRIPDVRRVVAKLREHGVELERYAFLGDAQDADGVWTSPDGGLLAWFKDPDGNLLVVQS